MTRALILAAVVGIAAAACSSEGDSSISTAQVVEPDTVLVTVEQTGGCLMMGPNCPTYVVFANGTVDLIRSGQSDSVIDSTVVDEAQVTRLLGDLAAADFAALRERLPVGECQGCYDGIDTVFVFGSAPDVVAFDSIETELTTSEPVFQSVWDIVGAARQSLQLPIKERP
jgi:hypothetical protein